MPILLLFTFKLFSKEERRQCCNFGEMIHNVDKSKYCLKPLNDKWWKLLIDNSTHFITSKGAIEYLTHQNLDEAIIKNVPEIFIS